MAVLVVWADHVWPDQEWRCSWYGGSYEVGSLVRVAVGQQRALLVGILLVEGSRILERRYTSNLSCWRDILVLLCCGCGSGRMVS